MPYNTFLIIEAIHQGAKRHAEAMRGIKANNLDSDINGLPPLQSAHLQYQNAFMQAEKEVYAAKGRGPLICASNAEYQFSIFILTAHVYFLLMSSVSNCSF